MNLKDVSKPSVASTKRQIREVVRRKSARQKLKEVVDREVRHLQNAAEHRGDKGSLDHARELSKYVAGALAITAPYNADGSVRDNGNKAEFWEWLGHMKDLLALRLPYERPRLASITVRDETPEEAAEYVTTFELRAVLMKEGLPVDHLDARPLMLEHDLNDDAGAHPTNGHATNGG